MPEMTEAIIKELTYYGKNKPDDFFNSKPIETLYFGGGTPSVLPIEDISKIIETVIGNYSLVPNPEITLEANPDDLSVEYCRELVSIGINRLSIGIQSFYDDHLKWMNRSHHATQAENCVENAKKAGINNISIDLIYGFPTLTDEQWLINLDKVNKLEINHLSSYSLTVEEKTPLKKLIETGRYLAPNEDSSSIHFKMLVHWAKQNNWEHYEISNFCKNGAYSKHNTSYWQQKPYLGIGPSAHSFNGEERRWNIKDNKMYVTNWNQSLPIYELEKLTQSEKLNDYILTSLRTRWGLEMEKATFIGEQNFYIRNKEIIKKYSDLNLLIVEDNTLKLTEEGKLYADGIASDFFS
jgi:oxygen-independent coproporphyrinogen-3 oxidase